MKHFIFLFSIFYFLFSIFSVFAADPNQLKESIEKKNEELQKINSQIQEIQDNLEGIKKEGQTLKKEVAKVNSQINQIKLGVRSSEVAIEKFGLEIESTQYKIAETEDKIEIKKKGVIQALQELQSKDSENSLIIFLKNKSLAESAFEIQGLSDLSANLASDVVELQSLGDVLNEKKDEFSVKKQSKESEYYNLKNKQSITEEIKKSKQTLLETTKNQEKNYQKQLSELEKQRDEISAEIGKIEKELRMKIDPTLLPSKRPGVLEWPVVNRYITQDYGNTSFASKNYKSKWHNGVDFGGPIGTPILAAEDGKVILADDQDKYCRGAAYGKYIVIQHENNLTTIYGHLSLQLVKINDYVKRGQLIGYVGKTGWATGPHLHFTVWQSATYYTKQSRTCGLMPVGGDINPLDYL